MRRVAATLVALTAIVLGGCAFTGSRSDAGNPRPFTTQTTAAWTDFAPGWEGRKGEAAVQLIDYPLDSLGYTVRFLPAREGFIGMTLPAAKVIEVYVRREMQVIDIAHVIAHEMGHAHDAKYLGEAQHDEYKRLRGFPQEPGWRACSACEDFDQPGGDFAEVFAWWALGGKGLFKSTLAPPPRGEELTNIEQFFRAP